MYVPSDGMRTNPERRQAKPSPRDSTAAGQAPSTNDTTGQGVEVWHRLEIAVGEAEVCEEPWTRETRIGLGESRIGSELELQRVRESVSVGIERGVCGVERIEAVRSLPSVGKSIGVGVGRERVCTRDVLREVGESVGVEVFRSVATERPERGVLPLVG